MSHDIKFLVDSNVMIEAHKRYYGFDLCPGFWDVLVHFHRQGVVASIDKVKNELVSGDPDDDLCRWAKELTVGFFQETATAAVIDTYREVSKWVYDEKQYVPATKTNFLSGADPWLIAYAKANNYTVITQEVKAPEARTKLPIPNVCAALRVECESTFYMLKRLEVSFSWGD